MKVFYGIQTAFPDVQNRFSLCSNVCKFVQNLFSGSLSLNYYKYFRTVMQRILERFTFNYI